MKRSQYSNSALLIARIHVFFAKHSQLGPLMSPAAVDYSRRFVAAATGNTNYPRVCEIRAYRLATEKYASLVLPGILKHHVLRKRFIQQKVEKLIASGARRVVVLAGGFDSMSLRLAKAYPSGEFIELDHPNTQAVKLKALTCEDVSQNLTFRSFDFTKVALSDAVTPQRDTVFVAEGVLMYLPQADVEKMFREVAKLSAESGHFIFSYTPPQRSGINGLLLRFLLQLCGEPLRWQTSLAELPDFIEPFGMDIESDISYARLQEEYNSRTQQRRLANVRGEDQCVVRISPVRGANVPQKRVGAVVALRSSTSSC